MLRNSCLGCVVLLGSGALSGKLSSGWSEQALPTNTHCHLYHLFSLSFTYTVFDAIML